MYSSKQTAKAKLFANTAISIGVLGTFLGISIGLYGFDVMDIEASIPSLLEGMKLAFVSSIAGMSSSILIKGISGWHDAKVDEDENINNLVVLFNSLNTQMVQLNETLIKSQSENLDRLSEEFTKFREAMARDNSEALIEALNKLVKEFNDNLAEQFGENFSYLNESIHELNKWQSSYKHIIESNSYHLSKTIGVLENMNDTFENINYSFEGIRNNAGRLIEASTTMNRMLNNVGDSVNNTLHTVSEAVSDTLSKVNKSNKRVVSALEVMDSLTSSVSSQSRSLEYTVGMLSNVLESQIQQITQNSSDQIVSLGIRLEQTIERNLNHLSRGLEDAMVESLELYKKRLEFDDLDDDSTIDITDNISVIEQVKFDE